MVGSEGRMQCLPKLARYEVATYRSLVKAVCVMTHDAQPIFFRSFIISHGHRLAGRQSIRQKRGLDLHQEWISPDSYMK